MAMYTNLYSLCGCIAAVLAQSATSFASSSSSQSFHYGEESFVMPPGAWLPTQKNLSHGKYDRAIFLSFDGMHQFDLERIISTTPDSNFTRLAKNAVVYSNARTSSPSDSMPATSSLFTGAFPRTHGVYWEQMWDRSLYTGGTNCTGPIGGLCDYSEAADLNNSLLTGGNGFNLTYLPHMKTSWGTCQPVLPHNFLQVNTIFEVARGNGLWTAFADKHLSYEIVNGPSGTGLSEGYFPEIASVDSTLAAQLAWDDLHWSALKNWTTGHYTNGTVNPVGGPSLYAANFQAITWAQQTSGYLDATGTPNRTLSAAFNATDIRLGEFLSMLESCGKIDSTLLLVGSKQGQGPVSPKDLVVADPQIVIDGAKVPVAFFNGENGGIMYLSDPADAQTAKSNLLGNSSLGISWVLAGDEVQANGFGTPCLDSRVPDLIIQTTPNELWNVGFEFEDHGGFNAADLNVPLMAFNPHISARNVTVGVNNRQVASTLLQALGLPLSQLQGYTLGEAPVLPGLF